MIDYRAVAGLVRGKVPPVGSGGDGGSCVKVRQIKEFEVLSSDASEKMLQLTDRAASRLMD